MIMIVVKEAPRPTQIMIVEEEGVIMIVVEPEENAFAMGCALSYY